MGGTALVCRMHFKVISNQTREMNSVNYMRIRDLIPLLMSVMTLVSLMRVGQGMPLLWITIMMVGRIYMFSQCRGMTNYIKILKVKSLRLLVVMYSQKPLGERWEYRFLISIMTAIRIFILRTCTLI